MLLTLLPLLLQVVTAAGAHPPDIEMRAADSAISLNYRVVAYLHAEPPIRRDTPYFEYFRADEQPVQAWLDRLDPARPGMQVGASCGKVVRRRLGDCEIGSIRPDTSANRSLALRLLRDMRVDAPVSRADSLHVDFILRNKVVDRELPPFCSQPFCIIEYGPPPPPPPAK